jgi:hypothetical protein
MAAFDDVGNAWTMANDMLAQSAVDGLLKNFGDAPGDNAEFEAAREVVASIMQDRSSVIKDQLERSSDQLEASRRYLATISSRSEDVGILVREAIGNRLSSWSGVSQTLGPRVPDPTKPLRDAGRGKRVTGGATGSGTMSSGALILVASWLDALGKASTPHVSVH